MKLLSMLLDNLRYSHHFFLVLESYIQDLIYVNSISLKVVLADTSIRLCIFEGENNGKLVKKEFSIKQTTENNYMIGFGCLVFKKLSKNGYFHRGYQNLIDFDPRFIFVGIL